MLDVGTADLTDLWWDTFKDQKRFFFNEAKSTVALNILAFTPNSFLGGTVRWLWEDISEFTWEIIGDERGPVGTEICLNIAEKRKQDISKIEYCTVFNISGYSLNK